MEVNISSGIVPKVNPRLAFLVDAENVSFQLMDQTYRFVCEQYGQPLIKRAYGNWSLPNMSPWGSVIGRLGFTAVQQFALVSGKNSSDICLCVDAVFLHFQQNIDKFVIMTTDSDFSNLFLRLRENGSSVILMGPGDRIGKLAPSADIVHKLSIPNYEATISLPTNECAEPINALDHLHQLTRECAQMYGANTGTTLVSMLGSHLGEKIPNFSIKQYGYKKLIDFLLAFPDKYLVSFQPIVTYQCKPLIYPSKYIAPPSARVNPASITTAPPIPATKTIQPRYSSRPEPVARLSPLVKKLLSADEISVVSCPKPSSPSANKTEDHKMYFDAMDRALQSIGETDTMPSTSLVEDRLSDTQSNCQTTVDATDASISTPAITKASAKRLLLVENVKNFIGSHGSKTKKELMSAFGTTDAQMRSILSELVTTGGIVVIGKGNKARYDLPKFHG